MVSLKCPDCGSTGISYYSEQQIAELADAMWQLLDDMGKSGLNVCLAAKGQARIAYEPFITDIEREAYAGLMSLEDALEIERQA